MGLGMLIISGLVIFAVAWLVRTLSGDHRRRALLTGESKEGGSRAPAYGRLDEHQPRGSDLWARGSGSANGD